MKTKRLDCSKCDRETTWVRQSDMNTGEAVLFGILTVGFAVAAREFWWKCTRCGKTIDE